MKGLNINIKQETPETSKWLPITCTTIVNGMIIAKMELNTTIAPVNGQRRRRGHEQEEYC
eukprot:scaffold18051_cov78-Skeletonema_dohrnii-CCMP3373.AAC.3